MFRRHNSRRAASTALAVQRAGVLPGTNGHREDIRNNKFVTCKQKILPVVLLGCSLVAVLLYARANLGYPGLWWDETAQFWISQGINHYADPGARPRGLAEALRLNRIQNLDPGGFTVLAHYWTKASRGIEWIRALPLSFLLVLMLCTGLLGWRLSRSWYLAAIGFALPLAYPGILYFGLENRAYGMEMAGVACGSVFLLHALEKRTAPGFLLLGLVCALFLTSRYSYLFFVMAAGFTLLYAKPAGWGRELLPYAAKCTLFCLPVAITGLIIFHYMLRQQLWPEMTAAAPLGVTAPGYVRASVLAGNENLPALLYRNTASLPAIPISLSIVYFLFVQGPLHQWLIRNHPGIRFDYKMTLVFALVLIVQATSVIVSYLGIYPWDIGARWNACLLAVSAIATLAIIAEARMLWQAHGRAKSAPDKLPWTRVVRPAATVCALAFIGFTTVQAATYRISKETPWTDVSNQIRQYHASAKKPGRLFVTWYEVPAVRYLYEYGPFRALPEYPEIFRFESEAEWRRQGVIEVARDDMRYVVSAMSGEALQKRFPHNRLVEAAPGRKPLLEITDQFPRPE